MFRILLDNQYSCGNSDENPLETRGPNRLAKGDEKSRVNVPGGQLHDTSKNRAWN